MQIVYEPVLLQGGLAVLIDCGASVDDVAKCIWIEMALQETF
jgi:hypothetical protein